MSRRRGLGRGLDALLSGAAAVHSTEGARELLDLPLDLIRRNRFQPRRLMDPEALEELANSIRSRGVVQPVVVRPGGDGQHYELVAGERRWRAAQMAELHAIPAVVKELSDEAALGVALVENIQRQDLNPIEEGVAIKRLIDDFDLTHQQAGDAVGRSRAAVSNLLRLLELRDDVRRLLESGELEMGHARALLSLQGEAQSRVAAEVVARSLSVRETEALVRRLNAPPKEPAPPDPDVRRLENDLSETNRRGGLHPTRCPGRGPAGHSLRESRRARRHSRANPLSAPVSPGRGCAVVGVGDASTPLPVIASAGARLSGHGGGRMSGRQKPRRVRSAGHVDRGEAATLYLRAGSGEPRYGCGQTARRGRTPLAAPRPGALQ